MKTTSRAHIASASNEMTKGVIARGRTCTTAAGLVLPGFARPSLAMSGARFALSCTSCVHMAPPAPHFPFLYPLTVVASFQTPLYLRRSGRQEHQASHPSHHERSRRRSAAVAVAAADFARDALRNIRTSHNRSYRRPQHPLQFAVSVPCPAVRSGCGQGPLLVRTHFLDYRRLRSSLAYHLMSLATLFGTAYLLPTSLPTAIATARIILLVTPLNHVRSLRQVLTEEPWRSVASVVLAGPLASATIPAVHVACPN